MAIEKPVGFIPVRAEERTRSFGGDCPRGSPKNYVLEIFRELVEWSADGKVRVTPVPRRARTGAQLLAMTFTRADGTTFTGAQHMDDLALALDTIAKEPEPPARAAGVTIGA